tara:strand:- start:1087 stop:1266 length:180 start_codon:yes stop_codon:yes gene_type:complete
MNVVKCNICGFTFGDGKLARTIHSDICSGRLDTVTNPLLIEVRERAEHKLNRENNHAKH